MTSPGLGGLQPPPMNAPPAGQLGIGIQPGVTPGIFIGRYVIIFGPSGGLFIYNGTPALGNSPIFWAASGSIDPYGNVIVPTAGVAGTGQFNAGNTIINALAELVYSVLPTGAPSVVQSGIITGAGSTITGTIAPTSAGSGIIVAIGSTGGPVSVTTAKFGASFMNANGTANDSGIAGSDAVSFFSLPNVPAGGTTFTATLSAAPTASYAIVSEVAHMGLSIAANPRFGSGNNVATFNSGTVTPPNGNNGKCIYLGVVMDNGSASTVPAGWTASNELYGTLGFFVGSGSQAFNGTFPGLRLSEAGICAFAPANLVASIAGGITQDSLGATIEQGLVSYANATNLNQIYNGLYALIVGIVNNAAAGIQFHNLANPAVLDPNIQGFSGGVNGAVLQLQSGIGLTGNPAALILNDANGSGITDGTMSLNAGRIFLGEINGFQNFYDDNAGLNGLLNLGAGAGPFKDTGWSTVSLPGSGGFSGTIRVKLLPWNMVALDVAIQWTNTTNASFTGGALPSAAYYPTSARWFPLGHGGAQTTDNPAVIEIPTSGGIVITTNASSGGSGTAAQSGITITYPTD